MEPMEFLQSLSAESIMVMGVVLSAMGLMMNAQRSLRRDIKEDMSELRRELKHDMDKMERNFSDLRKEVNSMGQRLAKLEGLLLPTPEGVRAQKSG